MKLEVINETMKGNNYVKELSAYIFCFHGTVN